MDIAIRSTCNFQITWDEVIEICKDLAGQIKINGGSYEGILAIARGGMIPAVILAGMLGIRTVKSYQVKRYNNKIPNVATGEEPLSLKGRWLIVDDIVSSGETLNFVSRLYPNTDVAVLMYYKWVATLRLSNNNVFLGEGVENNNLWIVFPWETVRKNDGE